MELIDKAAVVAQIEKLISNGKFKCQQSQENNDRESYIAWSEHIATCGKLLSFLNTLEVKEVDLEKEARHYLLNEHISPLNEMFHQADLNAEMMYHRDIENAFKAGVELGLKAKGE